MLTTKSLLGVGLLLLAVLSEVDAHTKKTTTTRHTSTTTKPTSSTTITTTSSSSISTTTPSSTPPAAPYRVGVVVFPGFTVLDVFGPLEAINQLAFQYNINVTILAETLDPVSSTTNASWFNPAVKSTAAESIVPTHTFYDHPPIDLLIIPGGVGTRAPAPILNATIDFVKKTYPTVQWILSICTGAGISARAGILDGKYSTTNKRSWAQTIAWGPEVRWVAEARWVVDGNIYSSSGVSAGTDATLAWISKIYGNAPAQFVANGMEWTGDWHDPNNDQFAKLYNLTNAANSTNQ